MHRLFLALPLPSSTQFQIEELKTAFPNSDFLHFETSEKLHITIAFIGKVSEKKKDALLELFPVVNAQPFEIVLTPLLLKSSSVIALKIKKNKQLTALEKQVQKSLRDNNFIVEQRQFTPHVTLARFKKNTPMDERKKIKVFVRKNLPQELFSIPVESFALYESTLTSKGSRYTIIAYENFSH